MDSNNDNRKGRGSQTSQEQAEFDRAREEGLTGRDADKLSKMEQAFVDNYFICFGDASKAARKAGYSEKSAGSTGYSLLQKQKIKTAIEAKRLEIKDDFRMSHEGIASFLMNVLSVDLTELFDEQKDGTLKLKKGALKSGAGIMLDSITIGKDKQIQFKVFSKQAAADMLAKFTGFYAVDNDQKKPAGVQIISLPDNGRGDGPQPSK